MANKHTSPKVRELDRYISECRDFLRKEPHSPECHTVRQRLEELLSEREGYLMLRSKSQGLPKTHDTDLQYDPSLDSQFSRYTNMPPEHTWITTPRVNKFRAKRKKTLWTTKLLHQA